MSTPRRRVSSDEEAFFEPKVLIPKKKNEWSTLLLYISAFLLQTDQNMLAPHLTAIAKEFGMSDAERDEKLGGGLAMGLFLVGGPASLVVGGLGDCFERRRLFALILALGAVASFGTATATDYSGLFWWRAITGISLGAALPLTFSFLGDIYGADQRTVVSARIGIFMSAGRGAGQVMSGFLGSRLGWRFPFIVVAIAFAVLAGVVVLFMHEPPRGKSDLLQEDAESLLETTTPVERNRIVALFRTPTVVLIYLQGIPGCIPWGVISVFLTDYISEDLGCGVDVATSIMSGFSLGTFGGLAFSGHVGQRLYNHKKTHAALYMAVAEILGAVPLLLVFVGTLRNKTLLFLLMLVTGFLATQTGTVVRSLLQNVVRPTHRSIAFAIFAIFDDLGKGGGPVVVARLISHFGRRHAFLLATAFGWFLGGAVNALVALTLNKDEDRLRLRLAPGSSHIIK